jgi:hypothetical protein
MIPKSTITLCKKLKIKVTRRTKSGRRVPKTLKQLRKEIKTKKRNQNKGDLFIQKANKASQKKGTIGSFGKWCKRKKLASKDGKVTMKCIKRGLKDKNVTIRRRANYARNIGGYIGYKRTPKGSSKRLQNKHAFGNIDQTAFDRYSGMNWDVPKSEFAKQTLRKVRRNCEDGESQILFNKIIPGMYVNLGSGKCLSVQEILEMSDTGRFLKNNNGEYINPFNRQPLTIRQVIKINQILQAAGRPLVGREFSLMTMPEILQQGVDIIDYWVRLVNRLRSERLSVQDQKNIINLISEMENSTFRILDADENTKWQFVQGRIYIMTPNGWMLPEDMGEEEWSFAVMNESEYHAFIEEQSENPISVLQPRRLFDYGSTKRTPHGPKRTQRVGSEKPRNRTFGNSFGFEKARKRALSFGLDKELFKKYQSRNFVIPDSEFPKQSLRKVRRKC